MCSNPLGAYAIARLIVNASPETTTPTEDQRKLVRPDVTPNAHPMIASANPIAAIGIAKIGRKKRSVLITPSTTAATPRPNGGVLGSDGLVILAPSRMQEESVAGHLREGAAGQVIGERQ